jgi:hypothetical protein
MQFSQKFTDVHSIFIEKTFPNIKNNKKSARTNLNFFVEMFHDGPTFLCHVRKMQNISNKRDLF